MTAPKIVVVVLIVFLMLFAAGIGLGARNGGSEGDTKSGWLDRLQSIVNHPKQLTARDMTPQRSTCVENQTLVITSNATCDYVIPKTKSGIRRASLVLRVGGGLRIQKFEGTDPANMPRALDTTLPDAGKRALDVDFYKNGGVLRLTCIGLTPCRADVQG